MDTVEGFGYSESQTNSGGPLAPGQVWASTNTFFTTNFGFYTLTETVSSTNAAATERVNFDFTVDAHATPYIYWNNQYYDLTSNQAGDLPLRVITIVPNPALPQAPESTQTAFGGTGGGETASAASPSMLGDPDEPAAEINLDTISITGSPYLTTDLAPFADLPPDYNLGLAPSTNNSHPFHIYFSLAAPPGVYTNIFSLGFSDEQDLPGADAPGSIYVSFTVVVTVPPPALGIWPANNGLLVAWFTNIMPFALRQSSDLRNWTVVTNTPTVFGAEYQTMLPMAANVQFFRLTTAQ